MVVCNSANNDDVALFFAENGSPQILECGLDIVDDKEQSKAIVGGMKMGVVHPMTVVIKCKLVRVWSCPSTFQCICPSNVATTTYKDNYCHNHKAII